MLKSEQQKVEDRVEYKQLEKVTSEGDEEMLA